MIGAERGKFLEVVAVCAKQRTFVRELDRLRGSDMESVLFPSSPINRMVDESTGRYAETVAEFAALVFDLVWTRLPRTDQAP